MKFSLSQSIAPSFRPDSVFIIITVILFLANANAVSSIPNGEFDSMFDTLRVRGYDLFCNAIVTSDLQFDLLFYQNEDDFNSSFHSFTFFAPTDSSLFALDMTQTASSYIDTLRLHIVPRRLSLADLRRLPSSYSLPTLLAGRPINVTRLPSSDAIAVGGVDIAFPGLYYGRDVAVHGLAGILSLRSNTGVVSGAPTPVSPVRPSDHSALSPRIGPNSMENGSVMAPSTRPVASPIPKITTINITSRPIHPPPPVQKKRTVHAPASEPTVVDSHSPAPAISPVIHGSSPASSPEIYLPAHTYVVKPVDSPGPAFTPSSESLEYRHSEITSPPTGYSDEAPAPAGPDIWVPKKVRVSLMETFTGGDQGQIETVDFADEVPEMPRILMEVQETRTEKSEPLDSIDGCVYQDVGLGLEHSIARNRYRYMQCRRHDE